ncbi:unnamed protein product [Durusdinium trenchii]|uniref:Uncharacterized protein n=1 Tax=Durusdinium trenchii TaxID=1381693 RepID=A0ABP0L2E5_9DINO
MSVNFAGGRNQRPLWASWRYRSCAIPKYESRETLEICVDILKFSICYISSIYAKHGLKELDPKSSVRSMRGIPQDLVFFAVWQPKHGLKNALCFVNFMGISPIACVFALPWLCVAVRPSVDEIGHRSLLLEKGKEATCEGERRERLREGLRGVGLTGEGNPCEWTGIECIDGCSVRRIESREASGNVASFVNMTSLEALLLPHTQVSGDLSSLQHLTSLRWLDLSHTQVSGDILFLRNLTHLMGLHLSQTEVSGDISSLQNTSLWRLDLSHTQVSGDLSSLQNLTQLRFRLDLSRTNVSGNLAALRDLAKLQDLRLAQLPVQGDVAALQYLAKLELADLSGTLVSGFLEGSCKKDYCQKLRDLNVADTKVGIGNPLLMFASIGWAALQTLNVSGSQLNLTTQELLEPLKFTRITRLLAANCALHGSVPSLKGWPFGRTLSGSLQVLDLSHNRMDAVSADSWLPKIRLDLSHNAHPLRVSAEVLRRVIKSGMELWLTRTELANRDEVMGLWQTELSPQEAWTPRPSQGFECQDLSNPNLRVTPELFLPEQMCSCSPGFFGKGADCQQCSNGTYSAGRNSSHCTKCPEGSRSLAGSTAVSQCVCPFGSPEETSEGTSRCRCDAHQALISQQLCIPCNELNLLCETSGHVAKDAPLEDGFLRLEVPSEEIFQCLDAKHCQNSSCAEGRSGPLCVDCAEHFHATGGLCLECKDISAQQTLCIMLGSAIALTLLAAAAWLMRHRVPSLSPSNKCLLQLLVEQLAALLQLTQLWAVLGRLRHPVSSGTETDEQTSSDPVLSLLEVFQFTSAEVQNFLALECVYDGVAVRSLFALATPLVPLLILLLCSCVEIFSRGLGIRVGLKILTVLFIGGASGSAQLLGCQEVDGAGVPLKDFSYRPLFPQQRCNEAPWVDRIGWTTALCYGVFIPCFLGFLFAEQNVIMRKVKMVNIQTAFQEGKVLVRLQGLTAEQSLKDWDTMLTKRLVCGAAAYVAVRVKGRAVVELAKDAVMVTPAEGLGASGSGEVESLVFGSDAEELEALQCHVMAQMLMERSILEQEEDRVMLGAKQLFLKYAKCENVWMEVCVKVTAAALVSVVAVNNLWLSVAITLGMALVIGLTRPFVQPQLNVLQTACFACLAVAAVGFRYHVALARLALAVPFGLLLVQLRHPDSPEMLALRLQQELEDKIHEGPVKVSAEQFAY